VFWVFIRGGMWGFSKSKKPPLAENKIHQSQISIACCGIFIVAVEAIGAVLGAGGVVVQLGTLYYPLA